MKIHFLFAALLPFVLQQASAQSSDLDPVTVTASLYPTNTSQTGRNVISIKGEALSKLPVHSVEELIRFLPGIEVQSRGPLGAQSDISVRGGTFQQTLVLVDGMRVNDPNTGHFSSYIPIAPTEIDRIEILKGASSAIYGSEAVGGVIHIITKSFARKASGILQYNAQLAAGSYGLISGNAGVSATAGKTSFSAGLLSNHTDGQQQRGIKGFVHANTVSASIKQVLSKHWDVALRGAFDKRRFAAQNFYTSFASDTAQETITSFWNQLQLRYIDSNHVFQIQAGYKSLQDSFLFNPRSATNQSKSQQWQVLVTDERRFGKQTSFTSGLQFINRSINSNDRGQHNLSQVAGFAVLNQQLGQHFFVSPALRLQWLENAGWELVPQLNAAMHYGQWNLRASAGKTFRDADFTERYNNYGKTQVASGQRLGNPDLVAEHAINYEVGADYVFAGAIKASATFFQRYQKRMIDYVLTPYAQINRKSNLITGAQYAYAKNISEVTTTGFETEINFMKALSKKSRIQAMAGLTFAHDNSSDSVLSFYLSSHAKWLTNFNMQYSVGRVDVAVTGLYKQRQSQTPVSPLLTGVSSDYFVLNSRLQVNFLQKRLGVFVQVDNLTDKHYTDLLGAVMPGRWWMGGLQYSFNK